MLNIFQCKEWEEFKLKTGYQKSYWVDGILVLQKNLPFGYSMLYSPMVSVEAADRVMGKEFNISLFKRKIKELSVDTKPIFYRLELDIPLNTKYSTLLPAFGLAKSFEEMQPEHTLTLDLTKSEEEILSQMKQKGRYNIKIAEKNGIEIGYEQTAGEKLAEFYRLYSLTGKRHKITYRSEQYFKQLLEILGKSGYARVYTGCKSIEGKKTTLAAAIMVYSGESAIYMFGSSSDEYKNLMAPYALHWQMIKDARNAGYKKYDFFGIAPDDNPNHPWSGITRFKKQFGGEQVDILGSYDLVFNPFYYKLFKTAEKMRRK